MTNRTDPESVALTPEMVAEVRAAVERGDYGSVSEVVRDALRDWRLRRRDRDVGDRGAAPSGAGGHRQRAGAGRQCGVCPAARPVRSAALRVSAPRRLLLSPRAAADLEEIADYIARDSPGRAATFRRRAGSEVPGGRRGAGTLPCSAPTSRAGLRTAVHGRYLVMYRDLPGEDTVRVERVLHSARDLPRLL